MTRSVFHHSISSCIVRISSILAILAVLFVGTSIASPTQKASAATGLTFCPSIGPGNATITFPNTASYIDVKRDYGAMGNGSTDDSTAIQNALNAARGYMTGKVVYFPQGTYRVTKPLVMTDNAEQQRTMEIQGQNVNNTIIKLDNNVATFGNGNSPRAVLSTFHPASGSLPFQGSAFATNIRNLTIDVGSGNPGAVGLTYVSNNQGTVRDVVIRSSDANKVGHTGLDMALESIPGPALVKHVLIEGFRYGINAKHGQYSMVFEALKLKNQTVAGIRNQAATLSMRCILSENAVPVVQQVTGGETAGMLVLLDSDLLRGATPHSAIDIQDGYVFARNIVTAGYAYALNDRGTTKPDGVMSGYKHGNTLYQFGTAQPSLNLPIYNTPEIPADPPSTWADVTTFGAKADGSGDSTQAIRDAISSGASTIYFPNRSSGTGAHYKVTGTIDVGWNVKRIIGMNSEILVDGALLTGGAVFKFRNGNQSIVEIQGFRVSNNPGHYWFAEQASSKTLILKNLLIRRGYLYRNWIGFGDIYMEDVHNLPSRVDNPQSSIIFKNQRVWARQLNPELGSTEIVNDGATLWILGFKSEQGTTMIETKNGGKTEVLGGLTINSSATNATVPAFISRDSSISIVHSEYRANSSRGVFTKLVEETRNGVTKTLMNTHPSVPSRKAGSDTSQSYVIPLYTGYV